MKFIIQFLLLVWLSSSLAIAQKGDYFLTHYSHRSETLDNINFDIAQDDKGVINIANRTGILRFDGRNWEHILTPAAIFSLSFNSDDKTLYMGGLNGLGKLVRDQNNDLVYQSLLDSTINVSNIVSITIQDGILYGSNNETVVKFSLKDGTIKTMGTKYSGELYKLFNLNGKVYISTEKSGLQLVGEDNIEETKLKSFDGIDVQFISANELNDSYLLGLVDNSLRIYKDGQISRLDIKDEDGYLKNSEVIDGIWINDSLSAIATLKGGVIFINHNKRTIEQIVNYQSGLPDNEIFAFSKDSNGGVWVAHSSGFTRISPNLPFRSFNKYEGLEGNIISVINHNDSLYVGTSLGLFYLQKVKNYEDVVYTNKRVVKVPNQNKPEEVKNKGFLGFLKKNTESPVVQKPKTRTIYSSKIRQELKSIRYQFTRVEGISSKVFHFVSHGDKLFCGGLNGLFEISGLQSKMITSSPIHTFAIADNANKIIAATYGDQIKVYELNTTAHEELDLFGDFRDQIQFIFEDNKGRIWLCSNDEIYFVSIANDEIAGTESFQITNPYYFKTFGAERNGQNIFINESGAFTIDIQSKKIIADSTVSSQKQLYGANGQVWFFNDEDWTALSEDQGSKKLNLLSVFKNISYISSDTQGNFWVVTDNNDLYKLTNTEEGLIHSYDLYLKRIKLSNKTLIPSQNLKFDQENSSLLFEFAQPEFSGVLDIKYQYKLEGLGNEWSKWSGNYDVVNFPYLPDGKYVLKMRSKNILGQVSEIEPLKFEVVPPYWKRPWFYAFEFSAMAFLLFISVRLKKLGFKYRLMSRLLALITLIIIIEFIQTVAENEFADKSSPVLDFLIQVSMAIIILPVESLIRKFIFKEKNVQILDFVNIKDDKKDKT